MKFKLSKALLFACSLALVSSSVQAQDLQRLAQGEPQIQQRELLDVPGQSYKVPEMGIQPQTPAAPQGQLIQSKPQALTILPGDRFPAPPAPKLGFQGELIYGYGMRILWTNYGSPAQRAGLEGGDVITQINGRPIRSRYDYDQSLREAVRYSGGAVRMVVRDIRGGGYDGRPLYTTVMAYLPVYGGGPAIAAARSQPQPAFQSGPVQRAAEPSVKGDF